MKKLYLVRIACFKDYVRDKYDDEFAIDTRYKRLIVGYKDAVALSWYNCKHTPNKIIEITKDNIDIVDGLLVDGIGISAKEYLKIKRTKNKIK